MPNRYRLKGASLEEIRRKAEEQHGPGARIVSAERVISPGIAGLFAGDRYEAIVEVQPKHEVVTGEVVPEADVLAADAASAGKTPGAASASAGNDAGVAVPSHQLHGAAIAALLAEADSAELSLHRPDKPGVSTESPGFAELLEQLGAGLRAPATAAPATAAPARPEPAIQVSDAPAPTTPVPGTPASAPVAAQPVPEQPHVPVPVPLTGIGDLVVLVGLGEDALDTALAMSMAAGGADVRTAGELSAYGHLHVEGRQNATAARAHAVLTERTVLVAFGLGKARNALARIQSVAALSPDQLWVVVDAGRKHDDTARWVNVLAAQLDVRAVAVVGAAETGTPESVNALGLPVGWVDAQQARSAQL